MYLIALRKLIPVRFLVDFYIIKLYLSKWVCFFMKFMTFTHACTEEYQMQYFIKQPSNMHCFVYEIKQIMWASDSPNRFLRKKSQNMTADQQHCVLQVRWFPQDGLVEVAINISKFDPLGFLLVEEKLWRQARKFAGYLERWD